MTIENLYQRVQSCSAVKRSPGLGLPAQIDVIANFMCDMAALAGQKR
jgi:hypothetical protein